MSRRSLATVVRLLAAPAFALLLLTQVGSAAQKPGETPKKRPNIILLLVDDFGWGDPACYGGTMVKTPGLDRLAAEGVRFIQGYVASPICSPSRCGIITGQCPARWKITSFLQTRAGNKACEMADFLDPAAPSLPRVLKSAGYATAHVGKWHLGGGRDVDNAPKFKAYGYDLGIGTWESPEPHPDITSTNWIWAPTDKIKRHERTRWMLDQALEFMRAHPGQPSFVNLWIDDTHTPYVPSDEQLKAVAAPENPQQPAKYRAVMKELDLQVARLMNELKGTNTLLILMGDNGALPTFDQKRVAGLRGSKLSLYEGGTRVPFIAWWPGHTPAGVVNEKTVISTLDLLPTLAKFAGASLPEGYRGDGEELTNAIDGKQPVRSKPLFWEYGRNNQSFAYPGMPEHRSPNVAVREGDWKLVVNADGTGAQLYDLAADRNETQDLAAAKPEIARRLTELALEWRRSLP